MSGARIRTLVREHAALLVLFVAASWALVAHARTFDFVCDDAFIAFRYARNLARWGEPVYNAGERVEGYTSPLFMALVAVGAKLGFDPPRFAQGLGALSGVGLLAASVSLTRRVVPSHRTLASALVLALAVLSAPIAAWTMGGLETPLFAALVMLSVDRVAATASTGRARDGAIAGLAIGLATLTRPEGALLGVLAVPVLIAYSAAGARLKPTGALIAAAAALVLPHLAFRLAYYGFPLPNTFYLKSSGDPVELRARGLAYLAFFVKEMSPFVVGALALAAFVPIGRRSLDEAWSLGRSRGAGAMLARLFVFAFVPYIASVGGDFLDLYRFFVPLLPLAFVLFAAALASLATRADGRASALASACVLAAVQVLAVHAYTQHELGPHALAQGDPERAEHGIEPLGWTREYALRWGAIGEFLGQRAGRRDWMAVGAAGAMPYRADMQNLDTFGLCDARVAHEGSLIGSRPGHQRFASREYILERRPVFLLIGNDYSTDDAGPHGFDPEWSALGYVWMQARIDSERYGSPTTFHHHLLVRSDRVARLANDPEVVLSLAPGAAPR